MSEAGIAVKFSSEATPATSVRAGEMLDTAASLYIQNSVLEG
jgi:hypothetical protein